ncbi:MAG: hypothetical protein RBT70_08395 [Alphaproteobacteria bacterium]|nr:hypothetical protein [Alphaproteobacteria bacterium]
MVFDPDFAHSSLEIGAGERGRHRQAVADHAGEGINLLGRDNGQRHLLLALESGDFQQEIFFTGFVLVSPIPDHVHIQRAALNCIQKAVLGLLSVFKLGLKFLDPAFIRTTALGDLGAKVIQKAFQIVSRADLLPEGIQDQAFQLFGWNVARWARGVAFAHAVSAFIVSIPTAFARGDGHARAAAIAFQKPRQQMGRGFTTRNAALGRERTSQLGSLLKESQINDGRNRNLDPFAFWFGSVGLAIRFVEDVQSHIGEA